WLFWRVLGGWRARAPGAARGAPPGPAAARAGAGSPFDAVAAALAARAPSRAAGETVAAWVGRIARDGQVPGAAALPALVALHYRHRFDPRGLDAAGAAALHRGCADWLARHGGAPAGRAVSRAAPPSA
ncbi:MAG: hypothetical protein JNM90_15165, partial [Burkholderiales bacterium]|nr:hypothetical protein [Burkholderiales bacterium]